MQMLVTPQQTGFLTQHTPREAHCESYTTQYSTPVGLRGGCKILVLHRAQICVQYHFKECESVSLSTEARAVESGSTYFICLKKDVEPCPKQN